MRLYLYNSTRKNFLFKTGNLEDSKKKKKTVEYIKPLLRKDPINKVMRVMIEQEYHF